MWELTGTPAANGLLNLWAQIYLLDKGEALGRTQTAYRDAFFQKGPDGFKWELKEGSKDEIYRRVSHLCLTMLEEDYLDLPELIVNPIPIEFPPPVLKKYKELEREFLLGLESGNTISAKNKGALFTKLRQFCNGAVYIDNDEDPDQAFTNSSPAKPWEHIHSAKLSAVQDIIEEAEGQPIIVAYQFKHDLARLRYLFPEGETLRDTETENRWNAGKIPLLFIHPASAGHGLNIQYGGAILIWFGLTWDLELYIQTWKRLRRQGQTKPVVMHIPFMDCKIERYMMRLLDNKKDSLMDLMIAMKKGE